MSCMGVYGIGRLTDLEDEVGNERRGFVLAQVVVLSAQHAEKEFEKFHGLHQHTGVSVKEPQCEPLQDQI